MINPSEVVFFKPEGLKKFKSDLFERVGWYIVNKGGMIVRHDIKELDRVSSNKIPIVGCTPELRPLVDRWIKDNRTWIYWDRGAARRVFATWLPRGENGGYYRWIINGFQMRKIREVQQDRWKSLKVEIKPWVKGGKHIVIACPTDTYTRFHNIQGWTDKTIRALSLVTDRQLVVRDKETKRPLQFDLEGAHAIVGHGTNALIEAAILGCPTFSDQSSAAALIGRTNLSDIEKPIYPDRTAWCASLAYSQFNEKELIDGTLFKLLG